jgi:hypothetical protein
MSERGAIGGSNKMLLQKAMRLEKLLEETKQENANFHAKVSQYKQLFSAHLERTTNRPQQ